MPGKPGCGIPAQRCYAMLKPLLCWGQFIFHVAPGNPVGSALQPPVLQIVVITSSIIHSSNRSAVGWVTSTG